MERELLERHINTTISVNVYQTEPVKKRIGKVIGILTDMLECIDLGINLQKTNLIPLKVRFDIAHIKLCGGFLNSS